MKALEGLYVACHSTVVAATLTDLIPSLGTGRTMDEVLLSNLVEMGALIELLDDRKGRLRRLMSAMVEGC